MNKEWNTTTKRFVVLLDIMGFKDIVSRRSHEDVYKLMLELSKNRSSVAAMSTFNTGGEIEIYSTNFSDSIILFSNDDSIDAFAQIINCAASIVYNALKNKVPIKGAIAHGEITVDRGKQIYFGQALIDAHLLHDEVQYYGVVAHNSIDSYLNEKTEEFLSNIKKLYFEQETPLKSGMIIHYNIDWFRFAFQNNNFDSLFSGLYTITSGYPRKYIDNTKKVCEEWYEKVLKPACKI